MTSRRFGSLSHRIPTLSLRSSVIWIIFTSDPDDFPTTGLVLHRIPDGFPTLFGHSVFPTTSRRLPDGRIIFISDIDVVLTVFAAQGTSTVFSAAQ